MLNVSDSYKSSMKKSSIKNRVSGTISLTTGEELQIIDSDIVKGSLSIDNKCINDSEFCFGSVYIGQLSVTIMNKDINRYLVYGAEVRFSYFLTLEDGSEEEIPLGVYYVKEATRTKKLIQLKCYDAMILFDEDVDEETFGTPHQLMNFICEKIGVVFATTEEEMNLMCNPECSLALRPDRVGTYRDAVSYIASVVGGFATINRYGEMEVRQFHTTSDMNISARKRTKSTVHDYETYFNSVTARFLADSNFYPYTETVEGMNTGLKLDMGDISMVYGMEEVKHEILKNILNHLSTIRYVPCSFSMISDPTIELGDMLTIENANSTDESVLSIVTGVSWTYHQGQTITCNGSDALLVNVKNKTQKDVANVEASVSAKNIVVKSYTNSDDYSIKGSEVQIIRLSYSSAIETTAIFLATIPVEMSLDGNLVLTYYVNALEHSKVTKYLERGKHFVTITNYFPSEVDETVNIRVCANTEYFESDKRQNDAKIISLMNYVQNQSVEVDDAGVPSLSTAYADTEIDTTIPTATILAGEVRASVHAQGLSTTTAWDGTLEIVDTIVPAKLIKLRTGKIVDSVQITTDPPHISGFADVISSVQLGRLSCGTVNDSVVFGYVVESATRSVSRHAEWNYNTDYINTGNGTFALRTIYSYKSQEEQIDSGRMCSVMIRTDDKASVEGVTIDV